MTDWQQFAMDKLCEHLKQFDEVSFTCGKQDTYEGSCEDITARGTKAKLSTTKTPTGDLAFECGLFDIETTVDDEELRKCLYEFALRENGTHEESIPVPIMLPGAAGNERECRLSERNAARDGKINAHRAKPVGI